MVEEEKVIQIENRAGEGSEGGQEQDSGDHDQWWCFWLEKERVPEIKEELKRLGLGAHGKKAELVARLEEDLSTEPSPAKPSNAEPNKGWLVFVLADKDTRTWWIN